MAAVCLSVCGVTFFSLIDGQMAAAADACLATSRSTASRESRPPARVGKSGPSRDGAELGEPGFQHPDGLAGQRCGPVFAAFAVAADVRAGAQVRVLAGEAGEFRYPQSGLDGEQEQGVVAAAVPGLPVGGGEQRVCFLGGEVADDGALAAAGRDGQDLADHGGVLGCPRGRVAEQGVDRGQPGVAGGAAVPALFFQVLQERADQRGVEVGEAEPAGRLAGPAPARRRAGACTCRGRPRPCSGWPSSAGPAGR